MGDMDPYVLTLLMKEQETKGKKGSSSIEEDQDEDETSDWIINY